MDVTTGLRLAAYGGILAMFIAAPVLADKVTIESGPYTLNGDIVPVSGQQLHGRVVLIVHGTLGHKDMELIEALQSVFMESGQVSLAINLSLNIDDREGFYPCDTLHTHKFDDAQLMRLRPGYDGSPDKVLRKSSCWGTQEVPIKS